MTTTDLNRGPGSFRWAMGYYHITFDMQLIGGCFVCLKNLKMLVGPNRQLRVLFNHLARNLTNI